MRLGIDTGGTFTDAVGADGTSAKVPSTPDDPGQAVRRASRVLLPGSDRRPSVLAHGTTVATNSLLEQSGARVALVTTDGLTDVIEIGRQNRPSLHDLWADRPDPVVPRHLRVGCPGRLGPDGTVLEPLAPAQVPDIPEEAEAVAVCLLHSDLNPAHERLVADILQQRGWDVSASVDVSPEFREFERTVTTAVNAYLRPRCGAYLGALADAAERVLVMTSAAGLEALDRVAALPAALLLSGPAGGVLAGADAAAASGYPDAVTFDMGGTSTDVCLVRHGCPEPAGERTVGGHPIRLPSLDIHTIGAGGGSIASIDPGGALAVGPRSAGAVPGPACYGHGGTAPTVTDANLAAGRLPADAELPGIGRLDAGASASALAQAGMSAHDLLTVVDAAMTEAVRSVTVARGVDPAGLALVAFGGAGPLHACAIAEALDMAAVVVPARAGVLSAVGCLTAPEQRDLVRTWPGGADHHGLAQALESLAGEAGESLLGAAVTTSVDCRYQGQAHEIRVGSVEAFELEHERRNGYRRRGTAVEVVALRATARLEAPVRPDDLPMPSRSGAVGPAVIAEADCTIWVADGWQAAPHPSSGALIITRIGDRS